uniref:Multidrug resistance protein 1 n=1 Tax=Schistocephalus solidus TaxID=70667 RepID=A0A183TK50_SCHSO
LKYASSFELFLCIVGIIMSCLVGSAMPVSFLFFSDIINEFIYPTNSNINAIETLVQRFAIIGLATFFVAFWQMFCLQLSAKLQAKRIRRLFYEAVLRQDVAWFDKLNVGTAITQLTEGVDKIETGIGEKLGLCIQFLLIFVSGLIIGFTKNWKLSLVACSVFPLVVVAVGSMGLIMRKFSVKERVAYSKANGIAGEVLSSIRTIFAFEGQIKEMVRYESELGTAEKLGVRRSILFNCVLGCTDASVYVLIAVTFWYGIVMINDGDAAAGDIILVVFAMIFGGSTLGQSFQQFDHFNAAKVAAAEIYETIDRIPPIDKRTPGKIIEKLSGEIVFRNVCFEYPLRKDVKILQDFNLTIRSGQTIAIVGPSSSGKSTVIQLIQRFYNPSRGEVGPDYPEFTFISEGGGGLSGGQKQHIAIARALIRNPRILLLDEATSALDTRSEAAVQKALENARVGRTVVIVAHRLSTVRDADVIMVVDGGVIKESGNHSELVKMNGIYAKLVRKSERI